jgi:hypothetical protein
MAIAQKCTQEFDPTGNPGCSDISELAPITGFVITTENFEFATKEDFATLGDWTDGIKAEKVFPVTKIIDYEFQDEEDNMYTSPLGLRRFNRYGKYVTIFKLSTNLCIHKALQSFMNQKCRVFFIMENGGILGTSPDDTKVKGFLIDQLTTQKLVKPTSGGDPSFSPIMIVEKNPLELNKYGESVIPTWDPASELSGLVPVTVSIVGTPTATSIVVKVVSTCGLTSAGADNTIPITGLVQADFALLKTNGSTQTISSMTDNDDGTYSFVTSGATTGTANIVTPENLSAGIMLKRGANATYTIS